MLTNSEYCVLMAIWEAEGPITSKEILERCEDKNFSKSTIHAVLNSLLEKKLIYVDGQKLSSRIYSRCFKASLSFEEYHSQQIKASSFYREKGKNILPNIISALFDGEQVNSETISNIEALLEQKKREIVDETDIL